MAVNYVIFKSSYVAENRLSPFKIDHLMAFVKIIVVYRYDRTGHINTACEENGC
jgi:hypothetical protein